MLYKMPMPLVVVGLPALLYVLLRNRWAILRSRWHLLGLVLFLLPWLPWAIAVSLVEDAAWLKWRVEFLDRFTGDLPNVAPQTQWKFYFTYLGPPALYCVPFTLSLPGALVRAFRRQPGANRDGLLFMAIWFLSHLAFFTVSVGKEWRYFLPALPPLFVLLGVELAAFFNPDRVPRPVRDRAGALAVWVLLPVGLAAGVFGLHYWYQRRGRLELEGVHTWSDVWQAYAVAAAILAAGFGLAAWLYVRRRGPASFGTIVATMWLTWLWAWPNVMPLMMSQRPFIDFAEQLADPARVAPALRPQLRNAGSQDSRIIWYSDVRIPRVIDQLELLAEQAGRRSLAYEIRRTAEEMLKGLAGDEPVLYVATLEDYDKLLRKAPAELARTEQTMPPTHLWLQTRYGAPKHQYVLFGNRPPPFAAPELRLPEEQKARRAVAATPDASVSGPPAPSE
jgi:4-amino-4-deoxy-L-arabinose transferase-like glycosyltransferase